MIEEETGWSLLCELEPDTHNRSITEREVELIFMDKQNKCAHIRVIPIFQETGWSRLCELD